MGTGFDSSKKQASILSIIIGNVKKHFPSLLMHFNLHKLHTGYEPP